MAKQQNLGKMLNVLETSQRIIRKIIFPKYVALEYPFILIYYIHAHISIFL